MILKTQASYPQTRNFVLKLHRDAAPADGQLIGRLEHVATGKQLQFSNAAELIACLAACVISTDSAGCAAGEERQ